MDVVKLLIIIIIIDNCKDEVNIYSKQLNYHSALQLKTGKIVKKTMGLVVLLSDPILGQPILIFFYIISHINALYTHLS